MSFKLKNSKFDKTKNRYPIARVIGGKDDKKYLYFYQDKKLHIDDLKPEFLASLNLSQEDKNLLNTALQEKLEPEEDRLDAIYYKILEEFGKKKERFILRGGGKLQVLPDFSRIEKLYICGISGSGKSTFSARWIKEYLRKYRTNEFYILSSIDEDEVLDKNLDPIRVDVDNLEDNPLDFEEINNSIVLFDDCATISSAKTRKMCLGLLDHLLECGRHFNTTVINTSHVIMDYRNSRKILNEATSVVIFPKAGSNVQNINYMTNYCGFNTVQINKILNLPSRWVLIRRTFPQMIIHEKGSYLI